MPSIARRFALKTLLLTATVAGFAVFPLVAQAKFQLGVQDSNLSGISTEAHTAPSYTAIQPLAPSLIRVNVVWFAVAGNTPFGLSNQADPHYKWTLIDQSVRRAAARNLQVVLDLSAAPNWAEGPGIPPASDPNVGKGAWEPNATLFGQFAHAVAERYSGGTPDPLHAGLALPRVKYYEMWNEPNLGGYIAGPNKPAQFRNLVNAGYSGIKSVHSDNFAILGGLAPISPVGIYSWHPLSFIRQVLCVRQGRKHYVRVNHCPKTNFDAAGVHPYALAATPTKPANNHNDILIHDVYKLTNVVRGAERAHTVNRERHQIWNTEWSWFTNPPQAQYGDPQPAAARYVAYSMYEEWKASVSVVIWQVLADVVGGPNPGGGLETAAGAPKMTMSAFGFPFIASVGKHHKGYAWGRAPVHGRVTVLVSRQAKGGQWHQVAKVHSDGYGVFQAHFKAHGNGTYRAQVAGGGSSLPYFSARIPGRRTHPYSFG
jgi:hypothetical protein